ncbi:MAG: DUF2628 domain-containing protein [Candidatus Faecalibacterium intestinavium]|uniref:DUF2628 domain-containing protein n=1 Tax=Candidatus Faecalibacterium intestinavium TaxID=2838580 RepID=A0A9E2NR47_9FIRM|nr:DUF2628 domain-containing protein [Candidatus Faecalibacterium intestinavium]
MYNFSGCPCSVCGKPLSRNDDVVVCPECGAPYHRACYESVGACVHTALHGTGFEWTPPKSLDEMKTCPVCGERNPADAKVCSSCRSSLEPKAAPEPEAGAAEASGSGFDYSRLYQKAQKGPGPQAVAPHFDPNRTVDGISCADWETYLGPFGLGYLSEFLRMQREDRKASISLGATFFGPFYFFYRKAWKPAFGFLGLELVLNLPTFFQLLQISDSPFAPGFSSSTLGLLSRLAASASFVMMIFRGIYGKYLYRRSAAQRIRRIQQDFPDSDQRAFVLRAQGGVSLGAVVGAFFLLMVLGAVFSLFLGPNLDAVLDLLYV